MHKLYDLKEKLINELEDYADNGKFSKDDVETIKYISSAVDHICNICEDADGYSEAMMMPETSYRRGMSSRRGTGTSYARGRGRNARRDSMGRYSSEGYSGAEEDFRMELEELIEDAPNEHVKKKMRDLMRDI